MFTFHADTDRHVFQLSNTEGIYPPLTKPSKTPDATVMWKKQTHYNGAKLKDIFAEEDEQPVGIWFGSPICLPVGHDNVGFFMTKILRSFPIFKTEAPCFVVYTAKLCG